MTVRNYTETEITEIKEAIIRQYTRLMRHMNHSPTMQELQDLGDDLDSMFEGNPDALA